ncbi:MAG: iron-containing alcohol dehydrogenase, partial [Leptospiraceae bacterium]|nr:iron-containing alcohol dehydrogenase [Leptospiraceae bacterium]
MPVLPEWVNYHFPPKIHIEVDCAHKSGSYIKNIGNRILIITTQKDLQSSVDVLSIKKSIERDTDGVIIYDDIITAATLKDLDTAAHFARQSQVNCVIA